MLAALAPLPPLLPPLTVGAVVGAVPHAAAVAPGTAPRAAAAAPTAELLALAAALLFLSGGEFTAVCFTLAEVEIKGVCHSAALVAPHVVHGLLWARKLRLVGYRHPFLVASLVASLVGVLMALVCYAMRVGLFSHATTSLLDEVTLQGSAAATSSSSSEVDEPSALKDWLMSPEFSVQEQIFDAEFGSFVAALGS